MTQLINIPAIFSKVPSDTIDIKKYSTHPANNYREPLFRYAKNYILADLEYSLVMLSENGDAGLTETFLDDTAITVVRKDIVSAMNNDNKMEYMSVKFGDNK